MEVNNIFIESLYEFKRARRSILFRVFVILAILGLIVYQFSFLFKEGGIASVKDLFRFYMDWPSQALASSIAFKSAYYFNIIQLLLVVCFVVSGSDRRFGTKDALFARPQGNSDIVIGSFLGKVMVITVLNWLAFITSIIFNLVLYPGSCNVLYYLFYWISFTFPTLIYFLGISYFVNRLVCHQGLSSLILILFFGGLTLWAVDFLHGILDPCARHIPNMFSDFTGHVNLGNYLLQRVYILLIGSGFLVLSIVPYPRIPNRAFVFGWSLSFACVLFVVAGSLALVYCARYKTVGEVRETYKQEYDKYIKISKARVINQNLHLRELEDGGISVNSRMKVVNRTSREIPLIMYLNPGLMVNSVEIDGEVVPFHREYQILLLDRELKSRDTCDISIVYEGRIENEICFLDVALEEYNLFGVNALGIYHFGCAPAFCERGYKLLTPECVWYPVCVPPYSLAGGRDVNFTRYSLEVEHDPRLTAISQGYIMEGEGGRTSFTCKHDMPGISLCIGDYKKREIMVDSTRVELYYLPGHEYLLKDYDFPQDELADQLLNAKGMWELPECVRAPFEITDEEWCEIRKMDDGTRDMGELMRLQVGKRPFNPTEHYPYRQLILLEVPCNFHCFPSLMQLTGEREQGGVVFLPEKLYSIKNYRPDIPKNEEERKFFLSLLRIRVLDPIIGEGSCDIKPTLRGRTTFISPDKYPIIYDVFVNMAHRSLSANPFGDEDFRSVEYLQCNSLKKALYDKSLSPEELKNIIRKKSRELYLRVMLQVREDPFRQFYFDFIANNVFREITEEEFFSSFYQVLGVNLDSLVKEWYKADRLPLLDIRDARAIKIGDTDRSLLPDMLYSFRVFNRSDVPGLVTTTDYQGWIIPPHEGRVIRTRNRKDGSSFSSGCLVEMPLAQNLPTAINLKIEDLENLHVDTVAGVFSLDSSTFFQGENMDEIIVDNEDSGFRLVKTKEFNIASLFRKEVKRKKYYKRHLLRDVWLPVIDEHFYGFPIQSALFKRAGSGKQKVEWNAQLPQEGEYEVFFYYIKPYSGTKDPLREFYYSVFDGKEEHDVVVSVNGNEPEGWISLGVFDFSKNARVTLSDRDRKNENGKYKYSQELVADAIKWARVKK